MVIKTAFAAVLATTSLVAACESEVDARATATEALVTWQWVSEETGYGKLIGPDYYLDGKLLGRCDEGVKLLRSHFWTMRDGVIRVATKPIPRPKGSNVMNLPGLFFADWAGIVREAQAARVTIVVDPTSCETMRGAGEGDGQQLPVPEVEVKAEQDVAPQSATRSELDSAGDDKPQPESEPRPR